MRGNADFFTTKTIEIKTILMNVTSTHYFPSLKNFHKCKVTKCNDCHADKSISNKTEWDLMYFPTVQVDNGNTD